MSKLQDVIRLYELLPIPIGGAGEPLQCRSEVRWTETLVPRPPKIDTREIDQLRELIIEAWLFRDVDYGQWGLHVFTEQAGRDALVREARARPEDVRLDDIILGEFLGDSDLLMVDRAGRVIVADPLSPRREWPVAAETILSFLEAFLDHDGEKFWENQRRS